MDNAQLLGERRHRLSLIKKGIAHALFIGVVLVVLQGFYSLSLVGKITNSVANKSHFMYFTQMYLKFCVMILTGLLVAFYWIKIYIAKDARSLAPLTLLKNNLILIPFAFMLIWALISTIKSPFFEKSLYGAGYINEGYFTVLQYGIIFLSAYAVRNEVKFSKPLLLWTFIVSAGVICICFTLIEITGYKIPTAIKCGVFNNSNHYGYFLAMSCTATFAAVVFSKCRWQLTLSSILLPFNVYELFVCNTLGANIAYMVGIFFIICSGAVAKKLSWWRLLIALGVSGLITLLIEVFGRTNMWSSYVEFFKDIKSVFSSGGGSGGGSGGDNSSAGTGRFGLWKRTVAVIKQVPWFGKGLDLYHANNIYDTTLDVAHNEYLTMASNIGIPGLLAYVATMIWWFVRAIRMRKLLKGADLALMAAAVAYLVSAMFGNSFTYTYPYFLVFFALSIQNFVWKKRSDKQIKDAGEVVDNSKSKS